MQRVKLVWQTVFASEHWNLQIVKFVSFVTRQPWSPDAQMTSPSGCSLQARVSFFLFVRQVLRQLARVVGTFVMHVASLVRHFDAHFWPALPAKHWAYAAWYAFRQASAAPAHCSESWVAARTHACVAGLKRWGASVVLVVVEVEVVVVAVCARPACGTASTLASTAIVMHFDGRDIDGISMRGRRARRSAACPG